MSTFECKLNLDSAFGEWLNDFSGPLTFKSLLKVQNVNIDSGQVFFLNEMTIWTIVI